MILFDYAFFLCTNRLSLASMVQSSELIPTRIDNLLATCQWFFLLYCLLSFSFLLLFRFDGAKIGISPDFFYSTLYKVKKIFFIERLFLPHYLHIVTISVAKVEILMDFQCQLDINFIQIPCSFPPDAPLNTAKVHVFLNMSSQLPSKLCQFFMNC